METAKKMERRGRIDKDEVRDSEIEIEGKRRDERKRENKQGRRKRKETQDIER